MLHHHNIYTKNKCNHHLPLTLRFEREEIQRLLFRTVPDFELYLLNLGSLPYVFVEVPCISLSQVFSASDKGDCLSYCVNYMSLLQMMVVWCSCSLCLGEIRSHSPSQFKPAK